MQVSADQQAADADTEVPWQECQVCQGVARLHVFGSVVTCNQLVLTRFAGRSNIPSVGFRRPRARLEVIGWQWVWGWGWGSSRALWLSQNKHYCFHKSSHFRAYFPLCPDLCNYGMHMCGKESLENEFLVFVKRLT